MAEILEEQARNYPDLAESYTEMSSLYAAKKYHQLTTLLLAFSADPKNLRDANLNLVRLYTDFVSLFESKISPLSLSFITAKVAESYPASDQASSQALLESALEKRDKLGKEPSLYLSATLAFSQLSTAVPPPSLRAELQQLREGLADLSGGDPRTHAAVYKAAARFHQMEGPPEEYYANALM
jgi:hypothetical protein